MLPKGTLRRPAEPGQGGRGSLGRQRKEKVEENSRRDIRTNMSKGMQMVGKKSA